MSKKQYTVSITRDITEECVVTCTASSEEEAIEIAYEKATATEEFEWHTVDMGECDMYVIADN